MIKVSRAQKLILGRVRRIFLKLDPRENMEMKCLLHDLIAQKPQELIKLING